VLANDAPIAEAKELAKKCTDLGLTSVMLFGPGPDNVEALTTRIKQAQAAGIGHVLVMGSTRGNDLKKWIENLKKLGPIAADHNVTIGIKPHGGNTGMGEKIAAVTKEVNHPRVKISYDAGNVMDYHKVDPLPDIKKCADEVRSFCIKDHRAFPVDEDCGPGLGEIDHYKLLAPVLSLGETIPLCCENIFEPVLPRPQGADGIDVLARRAREFLETVVKGLTVSAQGKK
jgi:sugar phosphate isomerase/epimerase